MAGTDPNISASVAITIDLFDLQTEHTHAFHLVLLLDFLIVVQKVLEHLVLRIRKPFGTGYQRLLYLCVHVQLCEVTVTAGQLRKRGLRQLEKHRTDVLFIGVAASIPPDSLVDGHHKPLEMLFVIVLAILR